MMSKTHITVGIATSLAVCMPTTAGGIFAAIIGGTAGGILCDIECRSTPRMRDALHGRLIALGLCVSLIITDLILKAGFCESVSAQGATGLAIGLVILVGTCLLGRFSEHRTFTHSLLFSIMITVGFSFITPELLTPVIAGCLSHLIIDTFNKKPVPWLYPIKAGFCLNLCYASKLGNTLLMWFGLATSVGLLIWRIIVMA